MSRIVLMPAAKVTLTPEAESLFRLAGIIHCHVCGQEVDRSTWSSTVRQDAAGTHVFVRPHIYRIDFVRTGPPPLGKFTGVWCGTSHEER